MKKASKYVCMHLHIYTHVFIQDQSCGIYHVCIHTYLHAYKVSGTLKPHLLKPSDFKYDQLGHQDVRLDLQVFDADWDRVHDLAAVGRQNRKAEGGRPQLFWDLKA